MSQTTDNIAQNICAFAKLALAIFVVFDTFILCTWFLSQNGAISPKFKPHMIFYPEEQGKTDEKIVNFDLKKIKPFFSAPTTTKNESTSESNSTLRWIFVITPTAKRLEQKADLTRFSQTLKLVKNLHWILVEDNAEKSDVVEDILIRTGLPYTHLAVKSDWVIVGRGMQQRNLGLDWLRSSYRNRTDVDGVVFFGDDDNSYDVRLFDEYITNVNTVGVWAVGLVGGAKVETPVVKDGKVVGWDVSWNPSRSFAIDMAGFAINLKYILGNNATFHKGCNHASFEPCFLDQFNITLNDLEPFGFEKDKKEILVWHTKTRNSGDGGSDKGFIL